MQIAVLPLERVDACRQLLEFTPLLERQLLECVAGGRCELDAPSGLGLRFQIADGAGRWASQSW
jgi:hypothetical protein